MTKAELLARHAVLLVYLHECVRIEDWHGVQDAASDIREVCAALKVLEKQRKQT